VADRSPASTASTSTWYGWQTLAADSAAIGLVVAGIFKGDDLGQPMTVAGLVTYLFVPPIIHRAHDRSGTALASAGLRIAAPSLGVILGASTEDCNEYEGAEAGDCGNGIAVGLLVGLGTAMAVDAIVFAHEEAPKPPKPAARGLRLVPAVSVTRERGELVLSGSF
jgi:hypothetical protein